MLITLSGAPGDLSESGLVSVMTGCQPRIGGSEPRSEEEHLQALMSRLCSSLSYNLYHPLPAPASPVMSCGYITGTASGGSQSRQNILLF